MGLFELGNLGIIGLLASGFILDLKRILSVLVFRELKKKITVRRKAHIS